MKVIKAGTGQNDTLKQWILVDTVIRKNMTPDMETAWDYGGYEALAPYACKMLGMHAMYRDQEQCMTFEFTEEQWTWFVLRWL